MYYVYVLKSIKDNNYFIGSTSDLEKRITGHIESLSKSTVYRRPFELVYYEASKNIKDASDIKNKSLMFLKCLLV